MPYAAVLDANVLHPIVTTEVLLRLADRGLFRPVWSREILDEVRESLERRNLGPAKIERRLDVMESYFPDAMADDIARLLPAVPTRSTRTTVTSWRQPSPARPMSSSRTTSMTFRPMPWRR